MKDLKKFFCLWLYGDVVDVDFDGVIARFDEGFVGVFVVVNGD